MGDYREKKRRRSKEEDYCDSESSKRYHPFTESIMLAPLNEIVDIPKIKPYDGTTDPEYHLGIFSVHMAYYGSKATDSIHCRAFPCTLTDHALTWFHNLPQNSIKNFSQLSSKFLSRFVYNKVFPKSPWCLQNLKQRDNELLEDYLNRFNQEALKVGNLDPELRIYFIKEGLKPGPFSKYLALNQPLSIEEFWKRAHGYADYEILENLHHNKRQR